MSTTTLDVCGNSVDAAHGSGMSELWVIASSQSMGHVLSSAARLCHPESRSAVPSTSAVLPRGEGNHPCMGLFLCKGSYPFSRTRLVV
jgi:hypothetical protein